MTTWKKIIYGAGDSEVMNAAKQRVLATPS